jgi:hypothetical protein
MNFNQMLKLARWMKREGYSKPSRGRILKWHLAFNKS